jgi:ketosteroid isomerase-like protein
MMSPAPERAGGRASSHADADMIRRAFATWNEEGPQALVERFWHEDAVYREMPGADAGVFRGRDAALERMQSILSLVGPIEVLLEDLIEAEDGRFVALVRMAGEASASAPPYTQSFGIVHRVRDGRIAEADYYLDPAQALDATGVTRG